MILGFWTLCDFVDLVILSLGVMLCLICDRELCWAARLRFGFVCF